MSIQSLNKSITSILDPPATPTIQPQDSPLVQIDDQNFSLQSAFQDLKFSSNYQGPRYQSEASAQTQAQEEMVVEDQQKEEGKRSYEQFIGAGNKKQTIAYTLSFFFRRQRKIKSQ